MDNKTNSTVKSNLRVKVNKNCVTITLDELVAYHNLPKALLNLLPGYKLMSSIGVEFTNVHNNRQACSASRASYTSSQINTGIQDNIDMNYQYSYIDKLPLNFNTMFKSAKKFSGKASIATAFFGKEHLQAALATTSQIVPLWNLNTSGCLRQYGVDRYNVFGEPYYNRNNGTFSDNLTFEYKMHNTIMNCDYIDRVNRVGYVGALPYLKSRALDNKRFLASINFINPHDTQEFWCNVSQSQKPTLQQMTFFTPYVKEQVAEAGTMIPYEYSPLFTDAYYKSKILTTNYFSLLYPLEEKTYHNYKNNLGSLPFKESYEKDYVVSSNTNNLFANFIGTYWAFVTAFSHPSDSSDIKSWKNLINNYYSLIIESDLYVYKLLKFMKSSGLLKTTSVIILSDHGDSMSAHGLKQKQTHYKESVNVPFMVYSPFLSDDIIGTKSNILGSLLDLAPTVNVLLALPKEADFAGKSLLKWSNNKLVIRTNNISVLNIYTSWMTSTGSYLGYKLWYFKLDTVPSNLVCNPTNFPDFICNFVMIIDYYQGKLYKFVRYFNLKEYLEYNAIFNEVYRSSLYYTTTENNFQVRFLSLLEPSFSKTYSSEITYITDAINNYTGADNSFASLYSVINGSSKTDTTNTLVFVYITVTYLNSINPNMYGIIPGAKSSYSFIKNNPNYYNFCHNLTDDPHEVVNLCDTNNYNSDNENIFNYLNDALNAKITQNNMDKFIYIIPTPVLLLIIDAVKLYGEEYVSKTAQTIISKMLNGNV